MKQPEGLAVTAERKKALLKAIELAWQHHPEWRLGQLISNAHGCGPQDPFYTEDDDMLAMLTNLTPTPKEQS
jgi:hypothetical protein